MNRLFASGGQSIGASASAIVLPVNTQGWFPLGLTGLIYCCPRDSQESFPGTWFEGFDSLTVSLLYGPTLTSIYDYWRNHSFDYMDLCWQSDVSLFNMLSESEGCSVVSNCLPPYGLYSSWNSLGQNTGVGSLSLLQGIFPTPGSNPSLPHCRQILYHLSHKGSPRIL